MRIGGENPQRLRQINLHRCSVVPFGTRAAELAPRVPHAR
jgi:hypothetical protein